jgi:hypothetical protein
MVYLKYFVLLVIFIANMNGAMVGQVLEAQQEPSQHLVLSKDYWIAKRALGESIEKEDLQAIRLALKSRFLNIKIESVLTMDKLGYEEFVPDMINALKINRTELRGTELKLEQRRLDTVLISALEQVTGLYLAPSDNPSEADITKVIEICRKWYDARHGK